MDALWPPDARLRLSLHGLAVELSCAMPGVAQVLSHVLGPFLCADFPDSFAPVMGQVDAFTEREVMLHLSPAARRLVHPDPCLELYRDQERFWLIDERWGMVELNILRRRFRSWVLPRPTVDMLLVAEGSVIWPLAQLVRPLGLHLLPAVSVVKDGYGVLIFSGTAIAGDLARLIDSGGYQLVSPRWTALREEDGRIHLQHLPGLVDLPARPSLRGHPWGGPRRLDLLERRPAAARFHAYAQGVVFVHSGRRPSAQATILSRALAEHLLREQLAPIELPDLRPGLLSARLAKLCRCAQVQLSSDEGDLTLALESLRTATVSAALRPRVSVTVAKDISTPRVA